MSEPSRRAAALALALLATAGCAAHSATADVVFASDGVAAHDGQRVRVRGIYTLYDARKRDPDEPPAYDGHAAIILEDGTRVTLEPIHSPNAIRSDEEIARFAGRVVLVTGVLTKLPPPQPDQPQDLVVPCISAIEEIRLP